MYAGVTRMHVSGRCGFVPPCESKVAASRTDADILNYKIKNTVRRSDGMVCEREKERERKTERDKVQCYRTVVACRPSSRFGEDRRRRR